MTQTPAYQGCQPLNSKMIGSAKQNFPAKVTAFLVKFCQFVGQLEKQGGNLNSENGGDRLDTKKP